MNWLTELLAEYGEDIARSMAETGYMMLVSLLAAVLIGLPLGMTVYLTERGGLAENRALATAANLYINIVRSFPFLLLVVFLIPFTRTVVGTSFGTQAATLPLCFVAVAIYARLTEQILREIPPGIPKVARAMGATVPQSVFRMLLPEARSGLVYALTSAAISLLSYSTVLGVVGGGGIGDFAMRYGYQVYNDSLMYLVIVIIIVCVLAIQAIGHRTSVRLDHR
ncbi:Methionine ABC transporter permease protein [Microbacterium esteraromaticum]|uniref:Methionine ABC transporter permease protein n=1 Tax=Microbacterium esteraromaticum TaxID=57043 RepID=A0A1R4KPG7_9MICO|nr:methionine ABC transporter permease [Microbacterium esteraromaticum]SJN46261.1 Methionine ABC transporter permease protein [Microbacterium esteraromaticum]